MTGHTNTISAPLVYKGEVIRDRGEMLSLTDMWKAAGADMSRKPSEWLASMDGKRFTEFLADSLGIEVGNSRSQLVAVKKGGRGVGGSTSAHWQIGLAYAKYLSPEFHMWCNQVVRERMELTHSTGINPVTLEQIERSFGIMRSLIHKVTEMEKALPGIAASMVEPLVAARLAEQSFMLRHGKTAKQIWDSCHLPPKIKGSAAWFGNRLAEMGCSIENEGRFDRGVTAIRLFDPDKAAICLRNGLLQKSRQYACERQGQGSLRLVAKAA